METGTGQEEGMGPVARAYSPLPSASSAAGPMLTPEGTILPSQMLRESTGHSAAGSETPCPPCHRGPRTHHFCSWLHLMLLNSRRLCFRFSVGLNGVWFLLGGNLPRVHIIHCE